MANDAAWLCAEEFPSAQEWADEIEKVLSFLLAKDQLHRFLSRLRARPSERDAALAEAWAGFFFHRNGFKINSWEPEAVTGRPGDLEVQWQTELPIFVEVKGPGWESELSPAELRSGRQHLPKYQDGEGRWFDPAPRISYAVEKALPKFAIDRPNLLVVVDDLFVSPMEWVPVLRLTEFHLRERLTLADCRNVGAVFLPRPICYGRPIEYLTHFVENAYVHPVCAIPEPVRRGFSVNNRISHSPLGGVNIRNS